MLADARGALGPYLSIFLLTTEHWDQASIGIVLTASGLAGIAVQTPLGALVDSVRAKRAIVVVALAGIAAAALGIALLPVFVVVLGAMVLLSIAGDLVGPAVAAITLGLVPREALARRLGRNAAFDHAGNVFIALVAGAVGWWISQRAVFLLVPIFAALAAASVLAIPARAIDVDRARGLEPGEAGDGGARPSGWRTLVECRPLLLFAGCVLLFHLANAPMLPLVSQKLALADKQAATALTSACIIAAQLIMLPMALLVGATADRWGRKPLLLAAYAILPIRGVLYTFSDAVPWLVGVQLLDGVGAGLLGALTPLVLADLMRGTGRYNVSQGAVATAQGIGASLSNVIAGVIVVEAGYGSAFLTLAGFAAVALAALFLLMPETRDEAAAAVGAPSAVAG